MAAEGNVVVVPVDLPFALRPLAGPGAISDHLLHDAVVTVQEPWRSLALAATRGTCALHVSL